MKMVSPVRKDGFCKYRSHASIDVAFGFEGSRMEAKARGCMML